MNLLAYVHLRNIHGSTGAGRVARQLVEHLDGQPGLEMRVLADPGDHQRIVPLVGEPWSSYRYHFMAKETSKQQAQWFFLGSPAAESYWPEAQIVFCTAESYVPTCRARLAVTLHDAAFFEQGAHIAGAAFWKQKLKWKLLYQTLSRKADLFHTVSEFSAERLAHFFPSIRSRLRVVHNAVPPRFFQPVSEEGQRYLRTQGLCTRPFILLPRGLAHRKNADLVLRSWPALHEQYPDLRLVITSHSDAPYLQRAKALGDSVLLTGFVSDEALCSLYHAARVVWFPSLYEGFGLPVLEAMACGAPVVASNSSSLPEVAGQAATLVSPNSDDEHIEAISELLDDAERRDGLRRAGIARASSFTWEISARKLYGHLSDLV
jgi:glycosyltransferase involved in cell wall biosynthesis